MSTCYDYIIRQPVSIWHTQRMHFDIDSTVQCKNYLKKTASICSNAIAWIFPRAYSIKLKFDWTLREKLTVLTQTWPKEKLRLKILMI